MSADEPKPKQRMYGPEDHQLTARWYPGEDGRPRFEIECACGKTRFVATVPNMKQPEVEEYTIEDGDTLGHIAAKLYGTSKVWKKLVEANPGLEPKRLIPGTTIAVPPLAGNDEAPR